MTDGRFDEPRSGTFAIVSSAPRAPDDAQPDLASVDGADLVNAARAGDTRALHALFARHAPLVRAVARRVAGSGLAEDVAQDALLEALHAFSRLRNPDALRAWLIGLTVRVARRRFRVYGDSARGVLLEEPANQNSAPPDLCMELRDLGDALTELPPRHQLALRLRRVDGLKLEEVATEVGASLATVKRWLDEADEHIAPLRCLGTRR